MNSTSSKDNSFFLLQFKTLFFFKVEFLLMFLVKFVMIIHLVNTMEYLHVMGKKIREAREKKSILFSFQSCAGFFKRSIRRNRQYTCKNHGVGNCPVDKTHRNQCRSCRLRRCLEAGMNKEGIY